MQRLRGLSPGTVKAFGALALAWLIVGQGAPALGRVIFVPKRYTFKIDPKTPVKDLLPIPPQVGPNPLPWLVKDLTQVPEALFHKPFVNQVIPVPKDEENLEAKKRRELLKENAEAVDKAQERTARLIAQINVVNQQGQDHFMKELLANRPDLAGLPWAMGDACRVTKERSLGMVRETQLVRLGLQDREEVEQPTDKGKSAGKMGRFWTAQFWDTYERERQHQRKMEKDNKLKSAECQASQVAALMQMLAPESVAMRLGLVEKLAGIDHADATRALARLAIFSTEKELREAAVVALKTRPSQDSTELLLAGLRYPWPEVVKNAGTTVIALERKDLVDKLVGLLDEPDPRAPVVQEAAGQKIAQVREVVRINHHHNCLLCHAPGNTLDVNIEGFGRSNDFVTAPVPSPGLPLPSPSEGYGRNASPDLLVRVDVIYLRQDFSLMQPVKNAAPWPKLQRFDFLVRTRQITAKEADDYQAWVKEQGPGYVPPHRQAALTALRALTGKNAPEGKAQAWRKVLQEK